MKMKLFEPLMLKFENSDWTRNPEFELLDTILRKNPHLIGIIRSDIISDNKDSDLGRGDTPNVDQIMRICIKG